MKKHLILLLLLFLISPQAFARVITVTTRTFDVAKSGTSINLNGTAITSHRIAWSYTGTITACQVKLKSSANNSTWADLIAAQACTSAGIATAATGSHNYVQIEITTLTGGGLVSVTYEGFSSDPTAMLGSSSAPAVGNIDMGNFVITNIGNAGTDFTPSGGLGLAAPLVITQGTLTGASAPYLSHTATWNNAATAFQGILSNVTSTLSGASSSLIDLQVAGISKFLVDKTGVVVATGSLNGTAVTVTTSATVAGNGGIIWSGSTRMSAPADGFTRFTNTGVSGFSGLYLGLTTAPWPMITVSQPVASQAQGIIIQRGDGTPQLFANLGAATNGSMIFCSDCTKATDPCTSGGTGVYAQRANGAWRCP